MAALLRRTTASLAALLLIAQAHGAQAAWAGLPLASLLEALRGTGVELAYSNELVPTTLRIEREPAGATLLEQARAALAARHLLLRALAPDRYVVVRDPATVAARQQPAAPLPPPPGATPGESVAKLDEVQVFARREALDIGAISQGVQPRGHLPGASDDALGALRQVPGIAADGSARPYVRGAAQDDVLVIFDHVPIPDPFHLKNFGNLANVFDPSVIDHIDLYTGGFPARYGARSGGVVELTPHKAESQHEVLLGASLSTLRTTGSGKIGEDADWLVALRHSLDGTQWLSAGDPLRAPQAFDGLARLHWHSSDARTWTAGLLALDNTLHLESSGAGQRVDIANRSQDFWLTTETADPGGWNTRSTLIVARGRSRRGGYTQLPGLLNGSLDDQRDLGSVGLQIEAGYAPVAGGHLDLGAEGYSTSGDAHYVRSLAYDPQALATLGLTPLPDADVNASLRSLSYAAYASYARGLGTRLSAELGMRFDRQRYPGLRAFEDWSPRLGVSYLAAPGLKAYASAGRYTQPQRPDERRFEESQYRPDHPQALVQETLGIEYRRTSWPVLRVEAYHKHWDRISPYFDNLLSETGLLPELSPLRVRVAPRSAVAQGVEVSLRSAPVGPMQYWASYSAAQVQDQLARGMVPRSWDQRDALNTGADYSRGGFGGTAVLRYHSGSPHTVINLVPSGGGSPQLAFGARNVVTGPDFVSLDLRAAWAMRRGSGELEYWGEVVNVLNRGNNCCSALAVPGLNAANGTTTPRTVNFGVLWRLR
jgi:hypothetical protein